MNEELTGRNKSLLSELDYKILDYLNKNKIGCMTDLINAFKAGSQHLSKRLKHLKEYGMIKSEKNQGKKINYSINSKKIREVNTILSIFQITDIFKTDNKLKISGQNRFNRGNVSNNK